MGNTMTTQREISETLRNPNGPYFAEGAPAMIALETMVDTVGLRNVLYALSTICGEKAEHLRANWQDHASAKVWDHAAGKLDKAAAVVTTPE